jgi:hypothetical protein
LGVGHQGSSFLPIGTRTLAFPGIVSEEDIKRNIGWGLNKIQICRTNERALDSAH